MPVATYNGRRDETDASIRERTVHIHQKQFDLASACQYIGRDRRKWSVRHTQMVNRCAQELLTGSDKLERCSSRLSVWRPGE